MNLVSVRKKWRFFTFSLSVFLHFLWCSFSLSQAIDSHLVFYLLPVLSLCQESYTEMLFCFLHTPSCFLHSQPLNKEKALLFSVKVAASWLVSVWVYNAEWKRGIAGMLFQHWEVFCFHHTDILSILKMTTGTVLAKDTRIHWADYFFPVKSTRISGVYPQCEDRERVRPLFLRASLKPPSRSAAHFSKFRREMG